MTLPNAIHIGTFRGCALERSANRPRYYRPQHSLAHALISGVVMAGFLGAATLWLGTL